MPGRSGSQTGGPWLILADQGGVGDALAERLRAQRVCIPGATHSPAVEAPETTASALNSFWNAAENVSR